MFPESETIQELCPCHVHNFKIWKSKKKKNVFSSLIDKKPIYVGCLFVFCYNKYIYVKIFIGMIFLSENNPIILTDGTVLQSC